MRLLYLLLFILLLGPPAMAAPPAKPKTVLRTDSSQVAVRNFSKTYLDSCRNLPEFQYNENKETGPSLWTRFWRWVWHLLYKLKPGNTRGWVSALLTFLQYLFLALGAGAIIFIILRLLGVDIIGIFKKKPASAGLAYEETLENIHEIDFDKDIESAIAQHNYRLAVRLLYLRSLKQLSDAGLIHWQIDKTNSAYINELKNMEQREAFTVLTRQFEYVWYGEFTINSQVFQNIGTLFTHFKQTLS